MPILECWAVQRTAGTRLGVTQGLQVSFTRAQVDVKQVDVEQESNWWGCCWTVILIIFQFIINLRSNNTGTAKALKSSSWTFHGNTTTIYCFRAARKLPKFFHVENFLFELLFRLGHVSWHILIPQMVHQDLTDFLTDWGDSGDA